MLILGQSPVKAAATDSNIYHMCLLPNVQLQNNSTPIVLYGVAFDHV